jgi:hypothetical protein
MNGCAFNCEVIDYTVCTVVHMHRVCGKHRAGFVENPVFVFDGAKALVHPWSMVGRLGIYYIIYLFTYEEPLSLPK